MTSTPKGTGADYLVHKSDLAKSRKDLPAIKDILIVEDRGLDADRLIGTLRSMFGYDIEVRRANTLNKALDLVLERPPELLLLDDYLGPLDTAVDSIPMVRRANYTGPLVVISGQMDRFRRAELMGKGADETINKDDLNSVAITVVLMRIADKLTQALKPIT